MTMRLLEMFMAERVEVVMQIAMQPNRVLVRMRPEMLLRNEDVLSFAQAGGSHHAAIWQPDASSQTRQNLLL